MMQPSEIIINVDESDFQYEVLAYSQNTPVVVDFWATWCRPCQTLSPLLEKIAVEANGAFRLAKVEVDSSPNLVMNYGVRTIPTVKAFSQAEVIAEFVGLQPEARLRDFFSKITPPSAASLAIEKGNSLVEAHQWKESEMLFRSLLDQNPDDTSSMLGLAKSILPQGKALEAADIIRTFPASREYSTAQLLLPLAEGVLDLQKNKLPDESDLDAAFSNCLRLVSRDHIPAAVDGLLDILRQDKNYQNGRARLVTLGLLELLGKDDPETRRYRRELASVLF